MGTDDNDENSAEKNVLSVSQFLSENYSLFAVAGILAALSVYLRDFESTSPSNSVELGVVSSLLMFLLVSAVLLQRAFNQAILAEEVDVSRIAGYSVLIMGISGLLYSIVSITAVFQAQLITILDIGALSFILTIYFIWFPNKQFTESTKNLSEDTESALVKIPETAVYMTLFSFVVYLVSPVGTPQLQKTIFITYSGRDIASWTFLIGVCVHYVWSYLLKSLYLRRDSKGEMK